MIIDPSFWAAFALVLLCVGLGRPLKDFVLKKLDQRIQKIARDIEKAATLREEAEAFLRDAKRYQLEVKEQAKHILDHAHQEATRLQKEAHAHVKEIKTIEENHLQDRIAVAEKKAISDIERRALEIALAAAYGVIKKAHTPEKESLLFAQSLKEIQEADEHFQAVGTTIKGY